MSSRRFHRLPIALQESIYDQIDGLAAADPSQLNRRASRPWCVHDFEQVVDDVRYTVFLTVEPDDQRQTLTILQVGAHPPT